MNKKLIFTLVFPITIITFTLFTKWWIVDVVDGTDGIMYGFPFIYKSPAFYTSMAEEYFITALIADVSIYFIAIFGVIYSINKYLLEIKVRKPIVIFLYAIAFLLFSFELLLASMSENRFSVKRDFDIVVKKTGFEFPFNDNDKKEFDNYHK